MVSKINPQDKELKWYDINPISVCDELGLEKDGRARYEIRNVIRNLQTKLISFNDYNEDNELKRYETQWIHTAEYDLDYEDTGGNIRVKFDDKLKPHLLELRSHFTKYHLTIAKNLKSKYSIRLYELLKQYEKIGKREIEYGDLRLMLGLDKTDNNKIIMEAYKKYNDFKKRVLLVAEKELKENTDIYFTYEEITVGRKIGKIKFNIKKNKGFDLFPETPQKIPAVVQELIEIGLNKDDASKIWDQQWNYINVSKRKDLIEEGIDYKQYLREKIYYLQVKMKEKKVDSPAAYLIKAIKENWDTTREKKDKVESKIRSIKITYSRKINRIAEEIEKVKGELDNILLKITDDYIKANPGLLKQLDEQVKNSSPILKVYKIKKQDPEHLYNTNSLYRIEVYSLLEKLYGDKYTKVRKRYDKKIKEYHKDIDILEQERDNKTKELVK